MAPSTVIAGLLTLVAGASALQIRGFPGANAGPGFVRVPISAPQHDTALRKRADVSGAAEVEIANFRTSGYTIDLMIGSPGQKVEVVVDTGSYELWVNPDCSKSSRAKNTTIDGKVTITVDSPLSDPEACRKRGRYDGSKSSSANKADVKNTVFTYGDQTTVAIEYAKDKIAIGGVSVDGQVFGVAKSSNQTGVGIMGFGPPPFGFNNSDSYPLILTSMAKQGAIKSPAFSLHLNDFNNTKGAVIFGGVDKKKYKGSLAKIPFKTVQFKTDDGQKFDHTSYYVTVKSMKLSTPGSTDTKSYDIGGSFVASLDSGSSSNLLPPGLGAKVCADLKGTMSSAGSTCRVDCAVRQQTGGMTFELDGKSILVPYNNLINEELFQETSSCFLMISDNTVFVDPPTHILGAPFLRSAYAVFDWGNGNLHIAQSADCGSNVVAIGTGVDSVPSGNGECSLGTNSVVNFGLMAGAALVSSVMLLV